MISHHLQIPGWRMCLIRNLLTETTMFGLDPAIDRVLNIEHGSGMGAPAHSTERDPQRVGDRVSQATISAGCDVQQMKTAVEKEGIEFFRSPTA